MERLTGLAARLLGLCAALAWSATALAGPIFTDPYGAGAPDVLGSDFDIRSLEVTALSPTTLRLTLRFDYHGGDAALAPVTVPGTSYAAVPVSAGDVLIQGQSSLWAIPVSGAAGGPGGIYYAVGAPFAVATPVTRPTLLAGSLYRVNGSVTASQALGVDPAADFRGDVAVWGAIETFAPDFLGFTPYGYSLGGNEVGVDIEIAIGAAFWNDVSAGYQVHFASTTCACDVIDGAVPEPSLFALALPLAALCLARARLCSARRGGPGGRERG